jgi:hypothetical protein
MHKNGPIRSSAAPTVSKFNTNGTGMRRLLCYLARMRSSEPIAERPPADPRYPIGRFVAPERISHEDRVYAISCLAELPTRLRNLVDDLDEEQLETPYRKGGWTVRQLVHHIADSHTVSVVRTRMALTGSWPAVPGYDEKVWAGMHDYTGPVEWSLELIESLHARWVLLLQSLSDDQWQCGYVHPKSGRVTVESATLLYAWHSRHHLAHISELRQRENW